MKDDSEEEPELLPVSLRQIIIETDGNSAKIVKAEVAGNIELNAILQILAGQFAVNSPVRN